MQAGGSNVNREVFIRGYFQLTPFSIPENAPYIEVRFHNVKTQIFPVKIHNVTVEDE